MVLQQLMIVYGVGGSVAVLSVLCLRIGMWLGNRWL